MLTEQINKVIDEVSKYGTLIYLVNSGSKSYGTNITKEIALEYASKFGGNWEDYLSDSDLRGVFISHRKFLLGTQKVHQVEIKGLEDAMCYSTPRYLQLALECNPNIVELCFVDEEDILYITEEGKELRALGIEFLTKNAYSRFGSYAFAQLKKLLAKDTNDHQGKRKYLLENHGVDTKAFMHHERLTDMGIEILDKRICKTKRPNAKQLLNLRFGIGYHEEPITIDYIKSHSEMKQKRLEEAMLNSTIPNVPDFDKINRWAVEVTDRVHKHEGNNGMFIGETLTILPLEYEMVDRTTLLLVSNPLVRRKNKSQAQGFCIPHKDWFTGLREFTEFKFSETTIEHIHKFVQQFRRCNPRHIDAIYAGDEYVLHQHPMATELKQKLKTLPATKEAYYTSKNYIIGNMKRMQQWEQLKEKHELLKREIEAAKSISIEEWESQFNQLELTKTELSIEEFRRAKDKLTVEHRKWASLVEMPKPKALPDIPKNTSTESASMMGKYGYDTITASDLVHVAKMFIELMISGTIVDSRIHEKEMYSVKHGHFKTYSEFEAYITKLLEEIEEAKEHSVLINKINNEELENWLIDFIERFHSNLIH